MSFGWGTIEEFRQGWQIPALVDQDRVLPGTPVTPPTETVTFNYLRPSSSGLYLRPSTTDLYTRIT